MGKLDGAVSTDVLFRWTWQNCLPTFQTYILAARRSKQDAAQEVVLLPPSINATKIPSLFTLAIARITTNLLYFLCTLSDYLSHNIVPDTIIILGLWGGNVGRSNISVAERYRELKPSWLQPNFS